MEQAKVVGRMGELPRLPGRDREGVGRTELMHAAAVEHRRSVEDEAERQLAVVTAEREGFAIARAERPHLGKPARRDTAEKPHRVTLSPGEKAHVVVGMPQATACEEADSRGIRVYPPGQTDSLHVQWHQTVCTNDEARSSVGPVQPGKTS